VPVSVLEKPAGVILNELAAALPVTQLLDHSAIPAMSPKSQCTSPRPLEKKDNKGVTKMTTSQAEPQNPMLILKIVWFVVLVSSVVLVGVSFVKVRSDALDGNEMEFFRKYSILLSLSIGLAILSFVIPDLAARKMQKSLKEPPGDPEKKGLLTSHINYIVRWGLSEAIVMMGFLFTMIYQDMRLIYVMGGISFFLLVLAKPQRSLVDQ